MIKSVFQDKKTKLAIIILALFNLLLLPTFITDLHSLSWSWVTGWQALFIFSNAVTSYYMYSSAAWKIPGIFLMLLTAFSVEHHHVLHYIFAAAFFLSCVGPLLKDKRLSIYGYAYMCTLPLFGISILWAELAAIFILLLYHSHSLALVWEVSNRRKIYT